MIGESLANPDHYYKYFAQLTDELFTKLSNDISLRIVEETDDELGSTAFTVHSVQQGLELAEIMMKDGEFTHYRQLQYPHSAVYLTKSGDEDILLVNATQGAESHDLSTSFNLTIKQDEILLAETSHAFGPEITIYYTFDDKVGFKPESILIDQKRVTLHSFESLLLQTTRGVTCEEIIELVLNPHEQNIKPITAMIDQTLVMKLFS